MNLDLAAERKIVVEAMLENMNTKDQVESMKKIANLLTRLAFYAQIVGMIDPEDQALRNILGSEGALLLSRLKAYKEDQRTGTIDPCLCLGVAIAGLGFYMLNSSLETLEALRNGTHEKTRFIPNERLEEYYKCAAAQAGGEWIKDAILHVPKTLLLTDKPQAEIEKARQAAAVAM